MGPPSPRTTRARGLLAGLVLLAAVAVLGEATASAGVLTPATPQTTLATTGDDSEVIQGVPIAKQPGAHERVVMSLGPDVLEDVAVGQQLESSAEVQISTTCVTEGPKCFGRRYGFNPTISTRIVLADGPTESAASFALSGTTKKLCKQQRPNRNHHCTLTISNIVTTIADVGALPCEPSACYVNLILGASSKKAKPGNKVVLGADEPDGSIKQDKGRLNVVQSPQGAAPPTTAISNDLVNTSMPATVDDHEKKRVVYSVPIFAPRKGEVIAFDSTFVTSISALRFNTFIAARVIIADAPDAPESEGIAKTGGLGKGAATESNGFNCTLGSSGYANPCTAVKAGATRIIRDVVDSAGQPATLYVNVVASGKPLLADDVIGAGIPEIALLPGSGLTVQRFTPPLKG